MYWINVDSVDSSDKILPATANVNCRGFLRPCTLNPSNFENNDYHCKTAKTLKEDRELIEAGFEFVTELDGIEIYRKRK